MENQNDYQFLKDTAEKLVKDTAKKVSQYLLNDEATEKLDILTEAMAEKKYQDSFLPIVTLADCIQYFKTEATKFYGNAAGFVLSVRKNIDPRNENDQFLVVQALIDNMHKPILSNGESVSRILHTKTIDVPLIQALKGKETGIFMK